MSDEKDSVEKSGSDAKDPSELSEVALANVSAGDKAKTPDPLPTENMSLNYGTIKWSYTQ
jgi:type VI protein secretion system component Hcp